MARILIVDDSDTARGYLGEALRSAGHEVVEGSNGLEGFRLAESDREIEFIVADYNMPEMDGITMADKIRQLEGMTDIPIFMLTAECSTNLKTAGKEAGVMAWIVKPADTSRVLAAINHVLGNRVAA